MAGAARTRRGRTMRFLTTAVLAATLFGGGSTIAQSWDSLYLDAMKDLEEARWQAAASKLEEAIKKNPESGHSLRAGVTATVGYFPYFLLGKAYYHLGRHQDALQSFAREDPDSLPRKMAGEIAGYQNAIRSVRAARRQSEFRQLVDKAEAAGKKAAFAEAANHLERARQTDPDEFAKRGLSTRLAQLLEQAKREDAERKTRVRFDEILRRASEKEQQGDLQAARSLVSEAEKLLSGQTQTRDLLTRIEQRESQYSQMKAAAIEDEKGGHFRSAIQKLEQAAKSHPQRFKDENLAQFQDSLSSREAIQQGFQDAARALASRSYGEAIAHYDLILEKDPNNALAVNEKARVRSLELLARGQYLAIEGSFDKALSAFGLSLITYRGNGYLVYDQMSLYRDKLKRTGLEDRWLGVMKDADPGSFSRDHGLVRQTPVQRRGRTTARRPERRAPSDDGALRELTYSALSDPPEEAIRKVEQARSKQTTGNAELESAAGIAYARLSLLTADQARREKLRARAKEHFRTALAIKPGQTVNPRLVSPQIMKIFIEVQEEATRSE